MWSSWPWVSTSPTTSSSRSVIASKPGRIRSTPGWSSSGNSTPQSISSSWPAYSSTAMFRPMSPRPPSGMIRTVSAASSGRALQATGGHGRQGYTSGISDSRGNEGGRSVACSGVQVVSGSTTTSRVSRSLPVRECDLGHSDQRGYDRRVPEALADSVRLAWPSEAAGIAAVQRRGWADQLPAELADAMLGSVSAEEMTEAWHGRSPGRRRPATGYWWRSRPDGSSGSPARCPVRTRTASRAWTARSRSSSSTRRPSGGGTDRGCSMRPPTRCAPTVSPAPSAGWAEDEPLQAFLVAAGWAPDGGNARSAPTTRPLRLRQVRLHTDLEPELCLLARPAGRAKSHLR